MTIWQDIERARQRAREERDRERREEFARVRERQAREKDEEIDAFVEMKMATDARRARQAETDHYLQQSGAQDVLEEVRRDVWKTGDIKTTFHDYGTDGESKAELRKGFPVVVDRGSAVFQDVDVNGSPTSSVIVDPPDHQIEKRSTSLSVSATRGHIAIHDSEARTIGGVPFDPAKGPDRAKVREEIIRLTTDRVDQGALPTQLEAEAGREIRRRIPFWRKRTL